MPKKKKGELPSGNVRYKLYIGKDADGNKRYKSFTAMNMKAAKQKAAAWRLDHRDPAQIENPTFSEAAKAFVENRSSTLSPSTLSDYQHRIQLIERTFPDFCKKHMAVITSEDVQYIVNSLAGKTREHWQLNKIGRTASGTLSPKTVSNYYGLIGAILKSQGITLSSVRLPQRKKVDLNIPENDIVHALLDSIKGTELEIPVLLAVFGPMRRGEICALKMDDINFETNTVHVCRSIVKNSENEWEEKAPKTTAGDRLITYPQYVIDLIKAKGYVTKWTPSTITGQFDKMLRKNGFEHFRFHDLRHFAASFQIALGIPPEYIMERGGWSTGYTMSRYVHALDKQRQEMASKTNSAFEKLL